MRSTLMKIAIDALIYGLAISFAYWARFDGPPPEFYLHQLQILLGLLIMVRLVCNFGLRIYKQMWGYFSLNDAILLTLSTALPSVLLASGRVFLTPEAQLWRVPFGVVLIDFLLATGATGAIRVLRRVWIERNESRVQRGDPRRAFSRTKVILVGAGMAGILVAREVRKKKNLNWGLIGFVDDDPEKLDTKIHGVPVIGTTREIPALVRRYGVDRVIITIANASSRDIRRIVEICEAVPVPVKIVPGMFEILNEKVTIQKLRDVAIDDLLGREVVSFEECSANMAQHLRGKRILITGAGGSIGSEICRQICMYSPAELLLIEKDENGLYEIDSELAHSQRHIVRHAVICDIRNADRLAALLHSYKPQVIFHAAAHKHVPLMEENPVEAVTNNIQGTLNLLQLCEPIGCERFVMLSTDKAVNPTSIMGASKRAAEVMIQSLSSKKTLFSCVRFGNVLGSRGSVVPLFQSQIRRGGPITLTDRNVVRYFLTIPEAVQLVIQASTLGSNGEIYVLDMGQPVKIVDLARDLIRLSGLDENAIDIEFTGLRPGEKLHEELYYSFEKATSTDFTKISSIAPADIDFERFWSDLNSILDSCESMEKEVLRQSIFNLISDCMRAEASQSRLPRPVASFSAAKNR
ncbi:MAG: polysaccharide biosynthesis protein [Acidobacteriota bacterium]